MAPESRILGGGSGASRPVHAGTGAEPPRPSGARWRPVGFQSEGACASAPGRRWWPIAGGRNPLRQAIDRRDGVHVVRPLPAWVLRLLDWIRAVPHAELEAIRRHLAGLLRAVDRRLEELEEMGEGRVVRPRPAPLPGA